MVLPSALSNRATGSASSLTCFTIYTSSRLVDEALLRQFRVASSSLSLQKDPPLKCELGLKIQVRIRLGQRLIRCERLYTRKDAAPSWWCREDACLKGGNMRFLPTVDTRPSRRDSLIIENYVVIVCRRCRASVVWQDPNHGANRQALKP